MKFPELSQFVRSYDFKFYSFRFTAISLRLDSECRIQIWKTRLFKRWKKTSFLVTKFIKWECRWTGDDVEITAINQLTLIPFYLLYLWIHLLHAQNFALHSWECLFSVHLKPSFVLAMNKITAVPHHPSALYGHGSKGHGQGPVYKARELTCP